MTRSLAHRTTAAGPGTRVAPVVLMASLANFVVLADATIVTVALPTIKDALRFSANGLPWVVNGYSLAFGGCLVLGGYAADRLGPRLPFVAGMVLFAVGSAGCAAADTAGALVAGRLVQGAGGALFSPAALAVVTATAVGADQRARALAVWSGAGACAVACGPVLGGALTGFFGWPSIFWLPALVCLGAATAGVRRLPSSGRGRLRRASPPAAPYPLRRVAGACAVLALASAALVGASYSATLWVQEILGLDPLRAGLALLPVSLGIMAGAAAAPGLTRLRGERGVAVLGLAVAALGMLLLLPTPVRVPMPVLVPALAVLAVGFGIQSVPVSALATVVPRHQGLASAAYQTAGQIGAGVGLVVLAAVAAARTAGSAGTGDQALVAGYHASFAAGAGALLLAALVAARLRRDEDVPPAVGDRHAVDADRPRRRGGLPGE